MDVLWRDREPAAAANNLHQAVHVARRALGAGRDRGARRGAARLAADGRRRPVRARRGRRAPRRDAGGLPRRARALRRRAAARRTATTTGRRRGATSSRSCAAGARRRARRARRLGDAVRGLPADTSSFVGREPRARPSCEALLGQHAPAHARRHGRRRQDAARARAGPRRRAVLRRRRRARRARRARRSPRSSPDAVAAALDVRALPGAERSATRSPTSSRRARLLLVLDNCEHLLGGDAQRSPTRCCAPRRS